MMDWPTTIVVVSAIGAGVAAIGIWAASDAAKDQRAINHEEFKAKLQPSHEERMAQIDAAVKSDVVKFTGKPVNAVQQINQG